MGLAAVTLGCSGGCEERPAPSASVAASASAGPRALDPEFLKKVLAKVGGRNITLGDYVATLERMNEFERLRYQSPDRRRDLLDELIDAELLAREAERRGLHKEGRARARINQALRDELLRKLHRQLPDPSEIPEPEVRRYYDEHRADFNEPERRRLAHIALLSRAKAEQVLEEARSASPQAWGKLVRAHSVDRQGEVEIITPLELSGDLGIVTAKKAEDAPGSTVAQPLRDALFSLDKIGDVYPEVVAVGSRFHIVRMLGKTDARQRSLEEAERLIRLRLLEQRATKLEADYEAELRKRYPVTIDEAQLKKVALPKDRAPED